MFRKKNKAPVVNILVIRLKSLGDVVLTLPATQSLRANYPDARISYLVCKSAAPLLEGFGDVDEVITIDRVALRKPKLAFGELFRILRILRRGRFQLVVDLQGYGETACLSWWTGAAERWGVVYGKGRRWAYSRGLTRDDSIQRIDWHLSMLRTGGLRVEPVLNEFHVPAAARREARELFVLQGLSLETPTVYIHAITSSLNKNWPIEKFVEVAKFLRGSGVQVLFGGGPKDATRLGAARDAGFEIMAGHSILVSAAIIERCVLVFGGDTGMLHLARAEGCRVLMLMRNRRSSGCPFPYGHPDWAIDGMPYDGIKNIPVEVVTDACRKALDLT